MPRLWTVLALDGVGILAKVGEAWVAGKTGQSLLLHCCVSKDDMNTHLSPSSWGVVFHKVSGHPRCLLGVLKGSEFPTGLSWGLPTPVGHLPTTSAPDLSPGRHLSLLPSLHTHHRV